METDNEIIAKFLGAAIIEEPVYLTVNGPHAGPPLYTNKYYKMNGESYSATDLKYHTSWDWLMPVVEKIDKMFMATKVEDDETEFGWQSPYLEVLAMPITMPIAEVHKAVVEFIRWYKENKP